VDVCVIGGGAAGMFAAITAARAGARVRLLERGGRVGRKLLATGNGRCNLTNTAAGAAHYYGSDPGFAAAALDICPPERVMGLFEEIGLLCAAEYGGRVFPLCNQASAVLDVLRNELDRLKVAVLTDSEAVSARKTARFAIKTAAGDDFACDRLIIAAGGLAAPSLGSNGGGLALLRAFGHTITKTTPALAQLRVAGAFVKGLRGIKTAARVAAFSGGEPVCRAEGDVLFADYGLSGTAVMDVSRALHWYEGVTLYIDFMPGYSADELLKILSRRRETLAHLTLENYLTGAVNKKLGQALIKAAGFDRLSAPVSSLTDGQIRRIASQIKNTGFAVEGHNGWENAQVTAGGALTAEFDPRAMRSRKVPGLFAAGEVLDIFGDCGGYNLQWAWASGYAAGLAAVKGHL